MGRILGAGLAGGLVLFVWGMVAHMVLPLGHMGFGTLPDEGAVTGVLEDDDVPAGMYMIPDLQPGATPEETEVWKGRVRAGPRALVIYTPDGAEPMPPLTLGASFAINVLSALVAALVVSQTASFYFGRVLVVTLMGLFAWLAVEAMYWNWYFFPTDRLSASLVEHVAGWFAAGLVVAGIVKGRLR